MYAQIWNNKVLSQFAVKCFVSYTTKELGKFALNEAPKLEEPQLLVILPTAIVADNVKTGLQTAFGVPSTPPEFTCPNRAKLHEKCADAGLFDKLTIPAVNKTLNQRGTALTKDSYRAIKKDIYHSATMDFIKDPVHKKIADYHKQTESQMDISKSFTEAGEHEGALMHKVLASGFNVRAQVYEQLVAPVERTSKMTLGRGIKE
jgi:hypothetical protein